MKTTKVGVIGCGAISDIYFQANARFDILEIVACSDLVMEKAEAQANKHGITRACPVPALLSDPQVEVVVNLTSQVPTSRWPCRLWRQARQYTTRNL